MSSRHRSSGNHNEADELEDHSENVQRDLLLPSYAEVSRYNPEEIIDWLERIGYLPSYRNVPAVRQGLLEHAPTGEDLLELGNDSAWFERFLPLGPAASLSRIVVRLREEARMFTIPFSIKPFLTIF
jgi:hypothetical protein